MSTYKITNRLPQDSEKKSQNRVTLFLNHTIICVLFCAEEAVQQSKYTPSFVGQRFPASPRKSQSQYAEHSAPDTVRGDDGNWVSVLDSVQQSKYTPSFVG